MGNTVECNEHGAQEATFVCRHLAESLSTRRPVGFYFASEARGDAWCSACEHVRVREGGETGDWNERSEAFAQITLLCGSCYDEVKRLNGFQL
jgi:hypothetical protein